MRTSLLLPLLVAVALAVATAAAAFAPASANEPALETEDSDLIVNVPDGKFNLRHGDAHGGAAWQIEAATPERLGLAFKHGFESAGVVYGPAANPCGTGGGNGVSASSITNVSSTFTCDSSSNGINEELIHATATLTYAFLRGFAAFGQGASRANPAVSPMTLHEISRRLRDTATELDAAVRDVAANKAKIGANEAEIGSNDRELSAFKVTTSRQITQVESQITNMLKSYVTKTSFTSLVSRDVQPLQTKIASLEKEIAANKAKLAAQAVAVEHLTAKSCDEREEGGWFTLNGIKQYCEKGADGKWYSVFQRRVSSSNFYRGITSYRNGFDLDTANFWLGLERVHQLTRTGRWILCVQLTHHNGRVYRNYYNNFKLGGRSGDYRITSIGSTGGSNCGPNSLTGHVNRPFSTYDYDRDSCGSNCARSYHGAWWYTCCHSSNLNGKYLNGNHGSYANGMNWYHCGRYYYSYKETRMMIRKYP